MVSTLGAADDLTVRYTASDALTVLTIVLAVLLPVGLAYPGRIYHVVRTGRCSIPSGTDAPPTSSADAANRASTAGSASPIGSSGHAAPDPMVLGRARRGPGDHDGPGHPSGGCPRIDTTEICTCGVSGAVSGDDESREHDMVTPSRRTDPSLQDLPRELLAVAAVLIGVSSALGLAGLGVTAPGSSP